MSIFTRKRIRHHHSSFLRRTHCVEALEPRAMFAASAAFESDARAEFAACALSAAGTGDVMPTVAHVDRAEHPPAVPVYNSLPGAPATLYLDFDGHYEAIWAGVPDITIPPYDADEKPNEFSDAELKFIEKVWQIVAEDFAPFNINVTTEQPPVFAPGVPSDQANGVALRVAIGGESWKGPGIAGVAQRNSFTNSFPNVAFAFSGGYTEPKYEANTVSHEAGHAFGLAHQSLYDANGRKIDEYLPSRGGWSAIMGDGGLEYDTWHNGPSSAGATDYQDDIAIIGDAINSFGFRPDEHGDTTVDATPLTASENKWSGSGLVGQSADVDMFSFKTTLPSDVTVALDGSTVGQNLDAVVEIYDAQGKLLASSNPGDSFDAFLEQKVAGGKYFVAVKSTGQYGRIGQFSLNVTASTTIGLQGTAGNDIHYVTMTSDGATLQVYDANPPAPWSTPIFTWPMNAGVPLAINTLGGDDSVVIDLPDGMSGAAAGILFDAGSGANQLLVTGGQARIDSVATGGTLNTTVLGGSHLSTGRLVQSDLTIGDNSRVTLLPDGGTSVIRNLTLGAGATLDITNNALVLDYSGDSPATTIGEQILSGRGGPGFGSTWTGSGITSSTAASANAVEPESRSVGYAENASLPLGAYATFHGLPVDDTAILIAYTRTGDANLDGLVNDDDVTILGATYAPTAGDAFWARGDFDYNGFVDDDDATLLGVFYNSAVGGSADPWSASRSTALTDGYDDRELIVIVAEATYEHNRWSRKAVLH